MTTILFPASTSEPYLPDFAFENECEAAKEAGFHVSFIGQQLGPNRNPTLRKLPNSKSENLIYRGWILKDYEYFNVENLIKDEGYFLNTSTKEYCYASYLPNWYSELSDATPDSLFFSKSKYKDLLNKKTLFEVVRNYFVSGGVIIKDYVKSRKHEWLDACYVPDVTDTKNLSRVVENFISLQDNDLVGGLVFRKFEPFKQIGTHSKSGMPIVNEHRLFAMNGKIIYQAPYWGEGNYSGNYPGKWICHDYLADLHASFVSIDLAELENGQWRIVEIGDGGTSGVPEGGDVNAFYKALWESQE